MAIGVAKHKKVPGIMESKRNEGKEGNTPILPSQMMEGRRLSRDDQNSRRKSRR